MAGTSDHDGRQSVLAVIECEVRAASSGDAAAYLGILDDEATFLPLNLAPKHGEELRELLRDFLKCFTVEWSDFVHAKTEVVGSLAYHRDVPPWISGSYILVEA